ncbi:hypothetical protein VP01_521g1 [Puccinia sorghi]|uniref:Peptidase A2 domain-containing protein n=1 Tax=Puccinia sorghi TaxID=27349 RepID=A0A0L6UKL8_9BASI|nr:hypothetical protein VP01_521g1 [Puccinia sorghi]
MTCLLPHWTLDEELSLLRAERYVACKPPQCIIIAQCIIIDLFHNGKHLSGIIDTGSEINLISEEMASTIGIPRHPLARPTRISLVLHSNTVAPILIQEFCTASLVHKVSGLCFEDVQLVGPVAGSHDIILGIPFLSFFGFSVSCHRVRMKSPFHLNIFVVTPQVALFKFSAPEMEIQLLFLRKRSHQMLAQILTRVRRLNVACC